ncbi:MAG: helix-turn-helix domain-containing protein [Bacteriovoracia bacterium]
MGIFLFFLSLSTFAFGADELAQTPRRSFQEVCRMHLINAISCSKTFDEAAKILGINDSTFYTIKRRFKIAEEECAFGSKQLELKPLRELERELIAEAITRNDGDMTKARKELGIPSGAWKQYLTKYKFAVTPSHINYKGTPIDPTLFESTEDTLEDFIKKISEDSLLQEKFGTLNKAIRAYVQAVYERQDWDLVNTGETLDVPILETEDILKKAGYEFPARRFSIRTKPERKKKKVE